MELLPGNTTIGDLLIAALAGEWCPGSRLWRNGLGGGHHQRPGIVANSGCCRSGSVLARNQVPPGYLLESVPDRPDLLYSSWVREVRSTPIYVAARGPCKSPSTSSSGEPRGAVNDTINLVATPPSGVLRTGGSRSKS